MAQLVNTGSLPIIFRSRNAITYTIAASGGTLSIPDSELSYDSVDSAIQAGILTVTLDSGLPFFDPTGQPSSVYVRVEPLGYPSLARDLAAGTSSVNTALTSTVRRVSLFARFAPIRYNIAQTSTTASATTSHFINEGERLDLSIPAGSNIAVIRDSNAAVNGVLCVSELV